MIDCIIDRRFFNASYRDIRSTLSTYLDLPVSRKVEERQEFLSKHTNAVNRSLSEKQHGQ